MIPARPGIVVHFKNRKRGRPDATYPVEAWSAAGEPMVLGRQGLSPAGDVHEIGDREVLDWWVEHLEPEPVED